jgi:CHAT domain-containing protein
LGRVRLADGQYESAAWLFDRAITLAASGRGTTLSWRLYHLRARARIATGRLREAMDDIRIAAPLARAWRWSGNDATRTAAEGVVEPVNASLIEAGNRLYLETHDPALIEETFEAAEESRDSSLRALLSSTGAMERDLPPAYWEALGRLQRAEAAALRPTLASRAAVQTARAEMVRMEAELLPDPPPPYRAVLRGVQGALSADTVLLSYHLGDSVSWLWAVDRDGIALFELAPRTAIEQQVFEAAAAIREETPSRAEASARLYAMLFGVLPERFAGRKQWLLALEGELLQAPVAALCDNRRPGPRYVAEDHIVNIIPGAAHWLEAARAPVPRLDPLFVGIGDPIYNTADPRIRGEEKRRDPPHVSPLALQAATPGTAPLQLPRLVASGAELDACVRTWSGLNVLLKGAQARRRNVTEQLGRSPAVVHFATHVLPGHGPTEYGVIVLGLGDRGETEVLSPIEIARMHIQAGVVVLSGCESATDSTASGKSRPGGYDVRPGAGWMGLTRAWLAAGAHSVVATRWVMPDVDGAFFGAFYGHLRSGAADAAESLRSAQLEMLHSGGWRAQPRYWGAYFVMGNR